MRPLVPNKLEHMDKHTGHESGHVHAALVPSVHEARALLAELDARVEGGLVVGEFIRRHAHAGAEIDGAVVDAVGDLLEEVRGGQGVVMEGVRGSRSSEKEALVLEEGSRRLSPASLPRRDAASRSKEKGDLVSGMGSRCLSPVSQCGGTAASGSTDVPDGGRAASPCGAPGKSATVPFTAEHVQQQCGFSIEQNAGGAVPDDVTRFLQRTKLKSGNIRNAFFEAQTHEQLGASYDNLGQVVQRYTFVAAMEPGRGATPEILLKILWCIKMMDLRHAGACKLKPKRGGGGPSVENIDRALPNDARCEIAYGHSMHKVMLEDEVVTIPVLSTRVYIDAASTGGESPLPRCYMFVEVSCPLTFDFMANINYSCSCKGSAKDAAISEELTRFWIEIASHQAAFGGECEGGCSMEEGMSIRFCDIFDEDKDCWLPKRTTAAYCVQAARQNMKLFTLSEVQRVTGCSGGELPALVVRFATLDMVSEGGMVPEDYDAVWRCFADRGVHAWHMKLKEFRAEERRHRTQQEGQKDSNFESADQQDGPPLFNPQPLPDLPREVDWENEDLAQALVGMAYEPQRNTLTELFDMLEAHKGGLKFSGFPKTWLALQVNMTLVLPETTTVCFRDFKQANKGMQMPETTTLAILMMKDQPLRTLRTDAPIDVEDVGTTFLREVLVRSDLRKKLMMAGSEEQPTLYNGRSRPVYDMQLRMIMKLPLAQNRVDSWSMYLGTTGFPYMLTVATSDTGERGGACPRIAALCEVAGSAWPGSKFRSCAAEGLHKWLGEAQKTADDECFGLHRDKDSIYGAYKNLNALYALEQKASPLKPENLDLRQNLCISDIHTQLSWVGDIAFAPNGIGGVCYIHNFGGSLFYHKRGGPKRTREDDGDDEELARIYKKRRGTGADHTAQDFGNACNPNMYSQPGGVKVNWDGVDDMRDTSELGLQYMLSQMCDSNGTIISQPQRLSPMMIATELPQFNEKTGTGRNMLRIISNVHLRNTGHTVGSTRTTVTQNAKTGAMEGTTQKVVVLPKLIALCCNYCGDNAAEGQFNAICYMVAAGADTSVGTENESGERTRMCEDMGRSHKFSTVGKSEALRDASRAIALDVQSVALAVALMHFYGLVGRQRTMFENCLFVVMSSIVLAHSDFMQPDVDISVLNRRMDIVRARLVCWSLQMHSMHAISAERSVGESFQEIVVRAAMAWRFDPVPTALFPTGMRMLMEQTFDWGFWLLLMIFADYFDVPKLEPTEVERLFSDESGTRKYPPGVTGEGARMTRWLHSAGFSDDAAVRARRRWGVLFSDGSQRSVVQQSAAYVSTLCAEDDVIDGSGLAFLVHGESREGSVSASSAARAVARNVARNLWKAYASVLRATCNIEKAEFLETMLERYLVREMPYPNFGALPSGSRFRSVNSVLRGFSANCADAGTAAENPDDGCFFDSTSHEVQAELKRRGGAYKTPVFLMQAQGGRRYRFGVDFRWLVLARSMTGKDISQTALRRVFVHFTAEYFTHRVPEQVYPYETMMTGTPDIDVHAFTVHDLTPHTPSPRRTTLVRPLPEAAVRDCNPHNVSGFIDGVGLEEGLIVNHMKHIATTFSAPGADFDARKCYVSVPVPPLARRRWTPLRLATHGEHGKRFFWAAIRTDETKHEHVLKVASRRVGFPDAYLAADRGASSLSDLERQNHIGALREVRAVSVRAALEHDPSLRTAWVLDYARRGIVLCLEVVPGVTLYAVLRPWACGGWFNPNTMGYAAFREGAPQDEHSSTLLALTAALATGGSGVHHDNVVQNLADKCHKYNDSSETQVLPEHVNAAVGEQLERFFHLCNIQTAGYVVPVGSMLLVDAMHPVVWGALGEHLWVQGDGGQYTEKASRFAASDKATAYAPALEAMFLYELPRNALLVGGDRQHGAYVGVRQYSKEHRVTHVLYMCLPMRALIANEMFALLEMNPAMCRVVSDSVI